MVAFFAGMFKVPRDLNFTFNLNIYHNNFVKDSTVFQVKVVW
jgi:hypothetical protein